MALKNSEKETGRRLKLTCITLDLKTARQCVGWQVQCGEDLQIGVLCLLLLWQVQRGARTEPHQRRPALALLAAPPAAAGEDDCREAVHVRTLQ